MPVIHISLTDEEFVDFAIMAREKGLKRVELAAVMIRDAMNKKLLFAKREDAMTFNAQGLPLAKRLTGSGIVEVSADGNPMVPQYERD